MVYSAIAIIIIGSISAVALWAYILTDILACWIMRKVDWNKVFIDELKTQISVSEAMLIGMDMALRDHGLKDEHK